MGKNWPLGKGSTFITLGHDSIFQDTWTQERSQKEEPGRKTSWLHGHLLQHCLLQQFQIQGEGKTKISDHGSTPWNIGETMKEDRCVLVLHCCCR